LGVPEIGSITGLRFRSQASESWPGVAPCASATAPTAIPDAGDLELSGDLESHRSGDRHLSILL